MTGGGLVWALRWGIVVPEWKWNMEIFQRGLWWGMNVHECTDMSIWIEQHRISISFLKAMVL